MQRMLLGSFGIASAFSMIVGCPSGPERADAARLDVPSGLRSLGTCEMPVAATVPPLGMVRLMGDTTDGPVGPLAMPGCGTTTAGGPPQEVIRLHVEGTGDVGLRLSLRQPGTSLLFDPLIEVRDMCTMSPGRGRCFDNYLSDRRSEGGLMVRGGADVYAIVTGDDEGAYELLATTERNTAPTLTAAHFRRVAMGPSELVVTGMDAEANLVAVGFQLLDAAGSPITIDGSAGPFDVPLPAAAPASFTDTTAYTFGAGAIPAIAMARQARIEAVDVYGMRSAALMVAVEDITTVGPGAACGATMRCRIGYACTGGMCVAGDGGAVCTASTAVSLTAPSTTTTTTSRNTFLPAGTAVLGGCADTSGSGAAAGGEVAFTVTVPAGNHDLIVSTVNAGTPSALDTAVFVRRMCRDPMTEIGCNDDDFGESRSELTLQDIAAGTYTVVVASTDPSPANQMVQLDLRLRPVLPTGAPCDVDEIQNRCESDFCDDTCQ